MTQVFLSYAEEDRERARALVQLLKKKEWTVFWDRDLLVGPNYRDALADELEHARCVIVLWSEESVHSEW